MWVHSRVEDQHVERNIFEGRQPATKDWQVVLGCTDNIKGNGLPFPIS